MLTKVCTSSSWAHTHATWLARCACLLCNYSSTSVFIIRALRVRSVLAATLVTEAAVCLSGRRRLSRSHHSDRYTSATFCGTPKCRLGEEGGERGSGNWWDGAGRGRGGEAAWAVLRLPRRRDALCPGSPPLSPPRLLPVRSVCPDATRAAPGGRVTRHGAGPRRSAE